MKTITIKTSKKVVRSENMDELYANMQRNERVYNRFLKYANNATLHPYCSSFGDSYLQIDCGNVLLDLVA
jgi:hypothetical protein